MRGSTQIVLILGLLVVPAGAMAEESGALAVDEMAVDESVEAIPPVSTSSRSAPVADRASDDAEFLFFRANDAVEARLKASKAGEPNARLNYFTPRAATLGAGFDSLLAPSRSDTLLIDFTPRSANAHVGLSYLGTDDEAAKPSLDIALTSRLSVTTTDTFSAASESSLAGLLDRRSYNVGLNIGYSGFNLGASVMREEGGLLANYEGYDVGLSYSGSSWSTSLLFGEYTRRQGGLLFGLEGFDNDYYSVELGASFRLSPVFSLSGAVRYFDYGANFWLDPEAEPRSGVLYFGTNVNF